MAKFINEEVRERLAKMGFSVSGESDHYMTVEKRGNCGLSDLDILKESGFKVVFAQQRNFFVPSNSWFKNGTLEPGAVFFIEK